ncbi:type IV secretion system protein [Sphingopyxis sp. BSN-002]|uniref:type IV secretion system protein n=1 Tax=Sphingopyxis sp. BSN-002 TaxID=2911495 RepID=UPI001EDAF800|nr:type IV secretion system protein [Sphingopyxis sp. BSN-002]UKK86169.1 type IV secretion system protein [Sphingopyxis sp. BSN-002]
MASICDSIPSPESFAPSAIRFLDCQAQLLGAEGYKALAAPGSTASILLTGMTTLLIAFIGYRMLFGQTPTIREGVLTFVKIGVVLVLATSWPAYQAIVYNIILHSPAELVSAIGAPTNLPGSGGGLVARVDAVDQALKILAIDGVGAPPMGPDGRPLIPSVAPSPFLGFDNFALGFSRVIFLVSTVGAFAIVRIAAALLLALAPLFAAFLLFDGTRGLFEGWLKAILGTALGSLAIAVTLGLELAFMEPWLAELLARRAGELDVMGAPAQLLAATTIFAIALAGVTWLTARIAMSLRIPAWLKAFPASWQEDQRGRSEASRPATAAHPPIESRSRAAAIADAVAINERREAAAADAGGGSRALHIARSAGRSDAGERYDRREALSSAGRRTRQRISSRAIARDKRL